MIHFVQQRFGAADVPIGSKAEIGRDKWHAGFGLNSGLLAEIAVVVCHECRRSKRRRVTVREMEEGPPGSAIRC